jgi:hypothetical protein
MARSSAEPAICSGQRQVTEARKIEDDPDGKTGCLITAHGIEENVKVVYTNARQVMPFRLSMDVPRAALVLVISGVAYLLYYSIYPLITQHF